MNINDEIAAEIENEKIAMQQYKERPRRVSHTQVKEARFVWMAGAVLVDVLTAWIVWQITGYWYYGLVWILAGAGGLLYSERLKSRIGNNVEQAKMARDGVNISAGAVFVMALLAGTAWVMRFGFEYMSALMEISALALFFFHLYQSYRYHDLDDEEVAKNVEALAEELAESRIKEAHRAARLVERRKVARGVVDGYRTKHGTAFDMLYQGQTEQVELKKNPTPPPSK